MNEKIRTAFFFIPYLLPVSFFSISLKWDIWKCILAVLFSMVIICIMYFGERKTLQIILDKEIMGLLPRISKESYYYRQVELLGSAIVEELFYRGYLLIELKKKHTIICAVVVVSIMFLVTHIFNLHAKERFDLSSYFQILILSFFLSALYLISENMLFPVIVHSLFNMPNMYRNYLLLERRSFND